MFALCKPNIKGGKKEAFLGGDVSEYIRANTTTRRQDSITTTSDTTTPKPEDILLPIQLGYGEELIYSATLEGIRLEGLILSAYFGVKYLGISQEIFLPLE